MYNRENKVMKNNNNMITIVIIGVVAVLFCLFFSHATSPVYADILQDSNTFALIGKGILEGKVPYSDLHENKGPLLFLIEALPQVFCKYISSVFAFQCVLMFVNIYLLYQIAYTYFKLDYVRIFLVELSFLIPLMLTYTAGNMAEEYDVFFSMLGSYFFIKNTYEEGVRWQLCGTMLGICTMAIFMIKMPDAAGLVGIDIMYIIYPLIMRKIEGGIYVIKRFFYLTVSGVVTLFFIMIYYMLNHATIDMLYHYFYINLKMVNVDFGITRLELVFSWYGVLTIFPVLVSIFNCIYAYKRQKNAYVFLSLSILTVFSALGAFTHTTGYIQHVMPIVVGCALSMGGFYSLIPRFFTRYVKLRILIYGVMFGALSFVLTKKFTAINYVNPINKNFSIEGRSDLFLLNYIPETDRDSVYRFGQTENSWYYYNGFYPYYKWLNLRTLIAIGLDEVKIQFEDKMYNDPVKYLVYSGKIDDYAPYFSERLIEYIKEKYVPIGIEYSERYGCDVGVYKYTGNQLISK